MAGYVDGFVFPIPRFHLDEYKSVAEQVAEIWKDHGALAYFEYVGDDLTLDGTRSFIELMNLNDDEVVVFGWTVFPSKEIRDQANAQVPGDPRMSELVEPLMDPERMVFDASRMVYGGFSPLVQSNGEGSD